MSRRPPRCKGGEVSKAQLTTNRGMNYFCIESREFQVDRDWFRIEIYQDEAIGDLKGASYKRLGCYWKPFSNQRCAMEKRAMLERHDARLSH